MTTDLIVIALMILVGGAFLITWWYATAVIQPRVRRQRKEIFSSYIAQRGGKEIPLPKMDSLTIFDFGTEKFQELNREAAEAHPQLGMQQLYADDQAELRLDDHAARVASGQAGESDETRGPILFWQVDLSGTVNGWARIRSSKSRFKGAFPEVNIESVTANAALQIHAHPKKLAFALFAPDLIDWYLQHSHQPWIYVTGNKLYVVVESAPKPGIFEAMEEEIIYLIHAIERSGALDK